MAKASTLRIRWRFNQQTGSKSENRAVQRAGNNFAQTIAEEIGLIYAEESYKTLKTNVEFALQNDVRQEVEHVARQFRQFIVGSEANTRKMRGELSTAVQTARGYALDGTPLSGQPVGGKAWTPRKKRYLREKLTDVGHQRWFEHTGYLGKVMNRGSLWLNAFGPIQIRLTRSAAVSSNDGVAKRGNRETAAAGAKVFGSSSTGLFSVGRIEASAFGKITPAMLPALVTGKMETPSPDDGRKTGLIGLVGNVSLPSAYRLGGGPNVPYRQTLEPFLAFAITRAIPTAVFNRIQKGLTGDIDGRGYRPR